jgi:hypothetical protein
MELQSRSYSASGSWLSAAQLPAGKAQFSTYLIVALIRNAAANPAIKTFCHAYRPCSCACKGTRMSAPALLSCELLLLLHPCSLQAPEAQHATSIRNQIEFISLICY